MIMPAGPFSRRYRGGATPRLAGLPVGVLNK
jgi:hypothetical protein